MYTDAHDAMATSIPTAAELIGSSAWAAEIPGLASATRQWLRALPPERARLAERPPIAPVTAAAGVEEFTYALK